MRKGAKNWTEYKEKVAWYFTQEWSEESYEMILTRYKNYSLQQDQEKDIEKEIKSIMWESWTAGSSVQNCAYFIWVFFKKMGKK